MNKVLIIDDDKELSALLKRQIEAELMQTGCQHSGHNGLEALLAGEYQLVVLDVMMP